MLEREGLEGDDMAATPGFLERMVECEEHVEAGSAGIIGRGVDRSTLFAARWSVLGDGALRGDHIGVYTAASTRMPPVRTPRPPKRSGARIHRKWAWEELNLRPHAYQACALTT